MKQRGRKKERRREEKKKERREHDDNVLLPAAATFPIRLPRKLIIAHFSLSIVVVYLSRNHDAVCVPQRNRRPRLLNGGARRVKRERKRDPFVTTLRKKRYCKTSLYFLISIIFEISFLLSFFY